MLRFNLSVKTLLQYTYMYICTCLCVCVLQGIRIIREYVYSLIFLGNMYIPWFTQGICKFPEKTSEYTNSLKFSSQNYTNSLKRFLNQNIGVFACRIVHSTGLFSKIDVANNCYKVNHPTSCTPCELDNLDIAADWAERIRLIGTK